MTTDRRCDQCQHSRDWHDGGRLMCVAGAFSHPCTWMRDDRSPCGPAAVLWQPKIQEPHRDGITAI